MWLGFSIDFAIVLIIDRIYKHCTRSTTVLVKSPRNFYSWWFILTANLSRTNKQINSSDLPSRLNKITVVHVVVFKYWLRIIYFITINSQHTRTHTQTKRSDTFLFFYHFLCASLWCALVVYCSRVRALMYGVALDFDYSHFSETYWIVRFANWWISSRVLYPIKKRVFRFFLLYFCYL